MSSLIYYVFVLIVAAIAIVTAPSPPNAVPTELDQLTIPTVKNGQSIPVVFGTVTLTNSAVVWYGDLNYTPIYS